jgi:PAS domain S-box-containing protein
MNIASLGIILALVGAGAAALIFALARRSAHRLPGSPQPAPRDELTTLAMHQPGSAAWRPSQDFPHESETSSASPDQAVLVILPGGTVGYLNQTARQWFNIQHTPPNLEWIARRLQPEGSFLELCLKESRERLQLDGAYLDASSCRIHHNDSPPSMLVILHRLEWGETQKQIQGQPGIPGSSAAAFELYASYCQVASLSLDLEQALVAILEGVERLLPADLIQVTVWDEDTRRLAPYRLLGLPGEKRSLEPLPELSGENLGYSAALIQERKPVRLSLHAPQQADQQAQRGKAAPEREGSISSAIFASFLGAPLLASGQFVGTLEAASRSPSSFTRDDELLIAWLAAPAAAAVQRAEHYHTARQEQLLTMLAELSEAAQAASDTQRVLGLMLEYVRPLAPAEINGILLYDEHRRMLVGKEPFAGIPPYTLEWCRASLAPGSPAEAIWLQGQTIVSNNAPEDPAWQALSLHNLAQAAGIQQAVLVPLRALGKRLGYLLLAKPERGNFEPAEIQLLEAAVARASGLVLRHQEEKQAQYQAQVDQTLHHLARLAWDPVNRDEILQIALKRLVVLMDASCAAVFLVQGSGWLQPHLPSLVGFGSSSETLPAAIQTDAPEYAQTAAATGIPILVSLGGEDEEETGQPAATDLPQAPLPYRQLSEQYGIASALILPIGNDSSLRGEMLLGSTHSGQFNSSDLQIAGLAAHFISGALEQAQQRESAVPYLGQQVSRTTALLRASREVGRWLEFPGLLRSLHDQALRLSGADCGTVIFFNLQASRTDIPTILGFHGDPPGEQISSLELFALSQPDGVLQDDPEPAPHPGVHASLLVPISFQEKQVGLIHVHAVARGRFSGPSQESLQALAQQAGPAWDNARRYQELQQRSQVLTERLGTLAHLFETSRMLDVEQPLEELLDAIASAIQAATPFESVLISVYQAESNSLKRLAGAGIPTPILRDLQTVAQPWPAVMDLLQAEFRVGRAYFIPAEKRPVVLHDLYPVNVLPAASLEQQAMENQHQPWHVDDLLLVPLFDAAGQPLGMVSVDAPRNRLRPERLVIDGLEIFCSQAALGIERYQQRLAQRRASGELLAGVRQQLDLASHGAVRAVQEPADLPAQAIDQRAARLAAGLDIAERVSLQKTRDEVLQVFGQELAARMGLGTALIAEASPGGPRLLFSLGRISQTVVPGGPGLEALLGQRNPLRQVLLGSNSTASQPLLVANLNAEPEWTSSPLLSALGARSFICLPITSQRSSTAPGTTPADKPGVDAPYLAVLCVSQEVLPPFIPEDGLLFSLLGRQVGVVLHSLELLENSQRRLREVNLLLDFSRQISELEPAGILRALVESAARAVPAVQAAFAATWDPLRNRLTPRVAIGYANNERMRKLSYSLGEGLPGKVFQSAQAVRLAEVDFARQYDLSADKLLHYRDATGGRLPVSTMVLPIQSPTQAAPPFGVLVLDNQSLENAFSIEDQALIASLVLQTALSLENARLYQSSEQRSYQLQALTAAAAAITTKLEPDELMASLLDQLQGVLPYDTGILWIRQGEQMVVSQARGFEDNDQRIGLTVSIQDSLLIGEMIQTRLPISVLDIRSDERFPSWTEYDTGPLVRRLSWLGVPLITGGQVTGVIVLEKAEPGIYTSDQVQIAVTFASQTATSLENARLYSESLRRTSELDRRSRLLTILNRLSGELSSTLEIPQILSHATRELYHLINSSRGEATPPCSAVSASLFDLLGSVRYQADYPPSRSPADTLLDETPVFERFHQGLTIYISEDVSLENELAPVGEFLQRYHTHSLLVVPMTSGAMLHGLLMVHTSRMVHFDPLELELARTIGNQTAIAFQNARLFAETRSLTDDLEMRVLERTGELRQERQRAETLLRIIMELSASLDLDLVLGNTLSVLSEAIDAEQITVLLARPGEPHLHRLASIGHAFVPPEQNVPTPFAPGEGLAGWIIQNRQAALINDIHQDDRWVIRPDNPTRHRSAIGVPLLGAPEVNGVMLIYHPSPSHFTADHLELAQAAANQVAVAVNNSELYRQINLQAENLAQVLRYQQVEASRSRAILEAVADGVLVTDAQRRVTLFNASAENNLGLAREKVLGRPLEAFAGIFGSAAQTWMRTIAAWSQDPGSYQSGITFAEQITLEDGRVLSVHLAPVSADEGAGRHKEFLGTVSVFRDVTHQVAVDRLKSEFVATVSHELRTPMTSIKGYVEVLLMGAAGALNDQQARFLGIVKTNTERLAILVNDLLDISRIESGGVMLSFQPLNLQTLVDEALLNLKRRTLEEGRLLMVEKSAADDLPRVWGDLDRVRQIFSILLENAYVYNIPGGQVTVTMHQVGDEIQIDIHDTGAGIPSHEQAHVFERFFRGEAPLILGVSGTGLGLSIAQNLVQMHNGRIWLESSGVHGEGSTFSFTLPIYRRDGPVPAVDSFKHLV